MSTKDNATRKSKSASLKTQRKKQQELVFHIPFNNGELNI